LYVLDSGRRLRCRGRMHCCRRWHTLKIFVFLTVTGVVKQYTEHIVAFPWRQQLRERSSMLRYACIAYLVTLWTFHIV
jgi:hypothetical protein